MDRISSNGSHTFLEGFCELRREVRTFRTDRIRGDIVDLETGETLPLRRLLAGVTDRSKPSFKPGGSSASRNSNRASSEWQQAVFFAGFSSNKRDELESLAEAAGWQVRQTITGTVTYVVAGNMAGKNQLAAADQHSVSVIDEDTFRALV